jgi:hypothetical protein
MPIPRFALDGNRNANCDCGNWGEIRGGEECPFSLASSADRIRSGAPRPSRARRLVQPMARAPSPAHFLPRADTAKIPLGFGIHKGRPVRAIPRPFGVAAPKSVLPNPFSRYYRAHYGPYRIQTNIRPESCP